MATARQVALARSGNPISSVGGVVGGGQRSGSSAPRDTRPVALVLLSTSQRALSQTGWILESGRGYRATAGISADTAKRSQTRT